jgi:hypothetical protein
VDAHCASDVHTPGQSAEVPSQIFGVQLGVPAKPAGATPHVPLTEAPRLVAHTSHAPTQGVLQQYPSAQLPVVQTLHPATLQSCPAPASHAAACTFCGRHVPLAAQ